jgi:hypothetical protein
MVNWAPCQLCGREVGLGVDGQEAGLDVQVVEQLGEALMGNSGANPVEPRLLVLVAMGELEVVAKARLVLIYYSVG